MHTQDVSGSPVVGTSNTGSEGSIPREGAKISHTFQPNKTKWNTKTWNRRNIVINSMNFFFFLQVQKQTGRAFSCLVLPRLSTFRKAEPILGKAKAPKIQEPALILRPWGYPASSPPFSFCQPLLLLSFGMFCPWAITFLNSLLLTLCTRVCIPLGRLELDHQFWNRYSNYISRINKNSLRGMTIIMHFLIYELSENVTGEEQKGFAA